MSISVIGAGFGRTGTLSLKMALEMLGLGPCYHMTEVFAHPEHAAVWQAAADGKPVDWDELLAGYNAIVDWPGCYFWKELAERYPEAKIVLSVRDAERWYKSVSDTIYPAITRPLSEGDPRGLGQRDMATNIILERTFGGRFEDRAHAIAVYERHNAEVQQTILPERLLVFRATDGWEPLCDFLGCPLPEQPFPSVNSTDEFKARFS